MSSLNYHIAKTEKRTLKNRLHQIFFVEKLNNVTGFILAFIVSVAMAFAIAAQGFSTGVLIIACIIGLPLICAVAAYPKLGIIILITAAFFLFYILRFGIDFPLGTLMDGFQALLIISFFFSQKATPGWKIFKNPITVFLLLWLLYNIVEVANPTAASRLAWVYTIRSVAIVSLMYFIFFYNIDTIKFLRLIIKLWIVLAFIGALYGYIQERYGYSKNEMNFILSDPLVEALYFVQGHWRKFSIFSDPVAFAYNMVVAAFLCLALIPYYKKFWKKAVLIALIAFYIGSMLYSGTRGAYVLLPAGLVMFVILNYNKKILLFSLMAGFILIILIFMPTSNITLVRFQSAFKPSTDESYNVRKINQKKIQPYILSHPIGGGLGATGVWGQRFAPGSYLANFPPDSGYIRVAVELGWIGLLIYCLLVFVILKTGINNYYRIRNPELKAYCLAMVMIVFVFNIGNFPQEALVQFPSSILFYLAVALISATKRLDDNHKLPAL